MYKIKTRELDNMEVIGDALYNVVARMYVYETYTHPDLTVGDISILNNVYVSQDIQSILYEKLNVKKVVDLPIMGPKSRSDHLEMYIAHLSYKDGYTVEDLRDLLFPLLEEIDIDKYTVETGRELNVYLGTTYRCNPSYKFDVPSGKLTITCNGLVVYKSSQRFRTMKDAKIDAASYFKSVQ